MAVLFNRVANITFGSGSISTKADGLRIVFRIQKSIDTAANKAKIIVYNLSQESRNILEEGKNLIVALNAGYVDTIDQLFTGDIDKAFSSRKGADIITTILAGDGEVGINTTRIEKSYIAGTKKKQIINDMVTGLKDNGKIIADLVLTGIGEKQIKKGEVVSGATDKLLSLFLDADEREFSVQDRKLQIIPKGGSTPESAFLLNSQTGLLDATKSEEGVKLKTLIFPDLRPGRKVSVSSRSFLGDFSTQKMLINGDTHGRNWASDMIATSIKT